MKIGFEAKKIFTNSTGIGNYCRRCIAALEQHGHKNMESILFVPGQKVSGYGSNIKIVTPGKWIRRNGFLCEIWRCFLSWYSIRRENVDIYHGLSNELPFFINHSRCKTVVTIHDLIFIRHPETYSWLSRMILRVKTYYACRIADHVIAVSNTSKQDIINFYGIDEKKISVVYQSISEKFRQPIKESEVTRCRNMLKLPEKYILCVGTIQTRKNQETIVKALAHLPEEIHAVLVGKSTEYQNKIVCTAKTNGTYNRLHILNDVPNEYLPVIYKTATVFVLPSIFEGFGIPIAEALASGTPVVAAKGSCLEEAGGPGSIYVGPYDEEKWANAILQICHNNGRHDEMVITGKEYSLLFTDKSMACRLQRVYDNIIKDTLRTITKSS